MNAPWSLLAPGPSLADAFGRGVSLPAGPVVALNRAILGPVRADFWCCQDGPHTWASLAPNVESGLVWCKDTQVRAWTEHGLRTWSHPADEQAFRERFVRNPKIAYTTLTITTALARMIHYGAREVHLFGVDMAGTTYFAGVDSKGRTPPVWAARWEEERKLLGIVMDQWRTQGVEFIQRTGAQA